MKTQNEIATDFDEEATKVWKNYPHPIVEVTIQERTSSDIPLMSILAGHRDYTRKAFGNTLYRHVDRVKLKVSDDALQRSDAEYRALLRHEAIHIGYPRHDEEFFRLAREVGAPFTEYEATDAKYQIQIKQGSRFVTIATFDVDTTVKYKDLDRGYRQAVEFAREYKRTHPDVQKIRLLR